MIFFGGGNLSHVKKTRCDQGHLESGNFFNLWIFSWFRIEMFGPLKLPLKAQKKTFLGGSDDSSLPRSQTSQRANCAAGNGELSFWDLRSNGIRQVFFHDFFPPGTPGRMVSKDIPHRSTN